MFDAGHRQRSVNNIALFQIGLMRVVAYSVSFGEKEPIAVANKKKHDITLVSNPLTERSAEFAKGKRAVIVCSLDRVFENVVKKLAEIGVEFIATRSSDYSHIDLQAAKEYGMRVGNVPENLLIGANEDQVPNVLAAETIRNLDSWQNEVCIGSNCRCAHSCSKKDHI